jgi:Putative capsular polysaccharide synthesis protein
MNQPKPMYLNKKWINRQVYEYFSVNIAPLLGWRDPILVYQMGKVGSSSIRNSLFRCQDPRTRLVLMCHEFFPIRNRDPGKIDIEPEYKEYVVREMEHDRRVFEQFTLRQRLGWLFRKKFYTERIYRAYVQPGGQVRAITLVRDPVAHNISLFFQVFGQYTGTTIEESGYGIDEMIRIFLDRYAYYRPLIWLDAELKTTLGIDVYKSPFPLDKGYAIMSRDNISLLVLKCELDDQSKTDAIKEFLGLEDFEIVRSNVTSQKSHAKQYQEFKQRIVIPAPLLDEVYGSKFAKHFYSTDELARLRAHWGGRSADLGHDGAGTTDAR